MTKCGNCKHWHPWDVQPYKLRQGDCDKVPKGEGFDLDTDTCDYKYHFDGYSFEDEYYDDVFNCFEPREVKE